MSRRKQLAVSAIIMAALLQALGSQQPRPTHGGSQAALLAAPQAAARQAPASLAPAHLWLKSYARLVMERAYGWGSLSQYVCLVDLWQRESGWNKYARNPGSGAYGIPQALPGSKMASAGPNWRTSGMTQIRWGLGYINARYGSPCAAWRHEERDGWYALPV